MKQSDLSELENVLAEVVPRLDSPGRRWLLGGSCSLLFQGVKLDKPPRDIDLYTDEAGVPVLHASLADWATDEPRADREGIYASMLSHYMLHGLSIELVGGFEVTTEGSSYRIEIDDVLYEAAPLHAVRDVPVRLMPLAHELLFNVLRSRPDRYEAIAVSVMGDAEAHLPLLRQLVDRNRLSDKHRSLLYRLLDGRL